MHARNQEIQLSCCTHVWTMTMFKYQQLATSQLALTYTTIYKFDLWYYEMCKNGHAQFFQSSKCTLHNIISHVISSPSGHVASLSPRCLPHPGHHCQTPSNHCWNIQASRLLKCMCRSCTMKGLRSIVA